MHARARARAALTACGAHMVRGVRDARDARDRRAVDASRAACERKELRPPPRPMPGCIATGGRRRRRRRRARRREETRLAARKRGRWGGRGGRRARAQVGMHGRPAAQLTARPAARARASASEGSSTAVGVQQRSEARRVPATGGHSRPSPPAAMALSPTSATGARGPARPAVGNTSRRCLPRSELPVRRTRPDFLKAKNERTLPARPTVRDLLRALLPLSLRGGGCRRASQHSRSRKFDFFDGHVAPA